MVRFTGYAKKDDPKWVSMLITALLFLLFAALFLGAAYLNQWLEKRAELRSQKPVAAATTTSSAPTTTTVSLVAVLSSVDTTTTSTAAAPDRVEENADKIVGVGVERFVLSSRLDGNRPSDELSLFLKQEHERVYGCTRIAVGSPPVKIHHVWVDPDGVVYADIPLTIRAELQDTWSYITVSRLRSGRWQLQVKDAGDQIIARKEFNVN